MNEPLAKDHADEDLEAVQAISSAYQRIKKETSKVIVGQDEVLEQLLIGIFARGHCLLEGVPGLAKTLMIRTVADALSLSFSRIQFTPDLMPADITGTEVIEENRSTGSREFKFLKGPIFANLILADEINRTPPKTQAALLEAMQEHQVTIGGRLNKLPEPFFVLATQNPIEQEGTYPLPEAQLDRFMFMVRVDYPSEAEEFQIVRATTAEFDPKVEKVLDAGQVGQLQAIVRRVPIGDHVIEYAMKLVRMTRRDPRQAIIPLTEKYIEWGAGPRASQYLVLAGKTRAVLHGRYYVTTEDIRSVALPVLRHRIVTNFDAEGDKVGRDEVIRRLIELLPKDQAHAANRPDVLRTANTG